MKNLERVRWLSQFLDNSIPIPGTKYRIGMDPLLGLIPGYGDAIAATLSLYIVYEAIQLGADRILIGRMLANIAIDVLGGSIPILGDLFDAGWKANIRNVSLLEEYLQVSRMKPQGVRVIDI